jgi:cytochrome c biogenesis protein CcmG, thiol:disulfide interchange protein DsbE
MSSTSPPSANKPASTTLRHAWRYFLPLIVFAGVVWFLWRGLSLNPREIPSALLDKPAPAFNLPLLHDPAKTMSTADMKGQVWLLNVWGSWCPSCHLEHPVLNELARQQLVPIIGFNWKDAGDAAKAWLRKNGDPYLKSVVDRDGRVAIDLGVYGAPETFIIDKAGVIRFKHTGPISPQDMKTKIMPVIEQLKKA